MGSPNAAVRSGLPSKAGECVTDNGMWIIDAPFSPLLLSRDLTADVDGKGKDGVWEINALAAELLQIRASWKSGFSTASMASKL